MLYVEPLLNRGDGETRFGYADDVAFLQTGPDTTVTTQLLAADVADVADALNWGSSNAVSFDPAKCELIHFNKTGAQKDDVVKTGDFEVAPATGAVRWLG
ncbi:hypothetical protein F4804DRAFT_339495, partial [Jackrogersella minutella]